MYSLIRVPAKVSVVRFPATQMFDNTWFKRSRKIKQTNKQMFE